MYVRLFSGKKTFFTLLKNLRHALRQAVFGKKHSCHTAQEPNTRCKSGCFPKKNLVTLLRQSLCSSGNGLRDDKDKSRKSSTASNGNGNANANAAFRPVVTIDHPFNSGATRLRKTSYVRKIWQNAKGGKE
jgi:hypothetical protein